MPPKRASPSVTPVPTTEANPPDGSALPNAQWKAMQDILNHVYDYRTTDGYDPSKVFHRKVNKRAIPAYYEVIKEPIALSTIKAKINTRVYTSFTEFVRDFALISHNAQVYNRPDAGAYQDALVLRGLLEAQYKQLVLQQVISEDEAKLPYLGEIPPQDELPVEEEEEEDDEDEPDEDDEDEGEVEGDTDEEAAKPRKRGRPRLNNGVAKREGKTDADKNDDPETRKKRGRPPKVLTPMEARIQAVLKGLRKPRSSKGHLKISHFERIPDKAAMPEYFVEIKNPMAFDTLKKKLKRKKYQHFTDFVKDVELMFENAKQYNEDDSQIYKDAVELQVEAKRLVQEEMNRPDTEYAMEEGRIPMPNGILHNGELWKVGDWVLIQNVNDLTKPIPCQVYRTWQDAEGGKWVNVCWYYRPEQTVHRFDKHFLDNEVVKTGQYRDHRIDEIVGRCFIMFFTRYFKGRPRGLPSDMDVFVCEARYNEEKFKFNKIKTWASCLPDEVRDKDYEMDLFGATRRMKKFPSPIAYLLKDDAKETDELPKPEWGAENAPPKIGGVHKRPRDERDSPPPEPTPTPPPPPPPAPARSIPQMSPHVQSANYPAMHSGGTNMTPIAAPSPARPAPASRPSFTPSHPQQYVPQSASPAPTHQRAMSAQTSAFPPATPHQTPAANLSSIAGLPQSHAPQIPPSASQAPQAASYRGPAPIEVYTLPDLANSSIPVEIRAKFRQDEHGRILFFTAPPIQPADDDVAEPGKALGHSIRYMAAKSRSAEEVARKRKAYEVAKIEAQQVKKQRRLKEETSLQQKVEDMQQLALKAVEEQMTAAIKTDMEALFGTAWSAGVESDLDRLAMVQREAARRRRIVEDNRRARATLHKVPLGSSGTLLDE